MLAEALLLLSLAASAAPNAPNAPKLDQYCEQKTANTPCQYKCVRNEANCGPDHSYKYQHLTTTELSFALHRHNVFRDIIASGAYMKHGLPPASNMMVMSWDKQCEWMTACWVLQCTKRGHDEVRIPVGQVGNQGQNLYRITSSDMTIMPHQKDINASIEDWFGEFKDLKPDYIDMILNKGFQSAPEGVVVGHLTQMIWAETAFVGCAKYKYITPGKTGHVHIFCNYHPAGNTLYQKMYLTGAPTSKCPPGTERNVIYRHLCGHIRKRKDDLFIAPVDLDPVGTKNRVKEEEEEALEQDKEEAEAAAKGAVADLSGEAGFVAAAAAATLAVFWRFRERLCGVN